MVAGQRDSHNLLRYFKRSWLGYPCDFDGKVRAKGEPNPVAERAVFCVVALDFVAVYRIQKRAHPAQVAFDMALRRFNCVQRHLKVAVRVGLVKMPGEIDPGKGAKKSLLGQQGETILEKGVDVSKVLAALAIAVKG